MSFLKASSLRWLGWKKDWLLKELDGQLEWKQKISQGNLTKEAESGHTLKAYKKAFGFSYMLALVVDNSCSFSFKNYDS